MSKQQNALRLALEALEGAEALLLSMGLTHLIVYGDAEKAITALREALQKEDLHKLAAESLTEGLRLDDWPKIGCVNHDCDKCKALAEQPAQRTWVGLTDEEIDQGLLRSDYAFKTAEAWRAGVVFAMTKLKEKNT